MVNSAKQHPEGSNTKSGKYMRDSIVNKGENNRSIKVLRPIIQVMRFVFSGNLGYAHNDRLTAK